jgi:hypothetical protein
MTTRITIQFFPGPQSMLQSIANKRLVMTARSPKKSGTAFAKWAARYESSTQIAGDGVVARLSLKINDIE